MNDNTIMQKAADNIRILAVSMVEKAKSGHPGGAMGGADFINVLFSEYLVYDPDQPTWAGRDRFFLDPGHMSPMLYSTLCLSGKFTLDEIQQFRQWGSPTPGHPELNVERGIENSSGPLGQGTRYRRRSLPWQRSSSRHDLARRSCGTRFMLTSLMVALRRK